MDEAVIANGTRVCILKSELDSSLRGKCGFVRGTRIVEVHDGRETTRVREYLVTDSADGSGGVQWWDSIDAGDLAIVS